MEFLKIIRKRSFINEVIYIILNVALAIGALILVRVTGVFWPALLLILISKWRIFAVRPRFWYANLQTNTVGIIVSVSYVAFLYLINNQAYSNIYYTLIAQLIVVLGYIIWLIFIKPKSKRAFIAAQATIAFLSGITAVFATTYSWPAVFVVAMIWLIGYSTTNHILSSYDEEVHSQLLSIISGLIFAELGWLHYHWAIAYSVPIFNEILIPQATIIMACVAFVMYKSYDSYHKNKEIRINDIILPLIFILSLIIALVLLFNGINIKSF